MAKNLWEQMIKEYYNRHPDANFTLWQLSPEEQYYIIKIELLPSELQPNSFKIEMYDIFWDLTHKEA